MYSFFFNDTATTEIYTLSLHDALPIYKKFRKRLIELSAIGIDMETATLFIVGHANKISRGAILLVSDMPLMPEGVKTQEMDKKVSAKYVDMHLEMGIQAMTDIEEKGEEIKHFGY